MAQWQAVAKFADLEEGTPLGVVVGDQFIGLFRIGERCYAVSNICTHELALLSDGWQEGACVECPLHQARFDVTTGKCLGPPADEDLATFEVKIQDGMVLVLA